MDIDIAQGDQSVINVALRRIREGVRVDVKVAPQVEEFFRFWGGGGNTDISINGRLWRPMPGRTAPHPLRVWSLMAIGHGDAEFEGAPREFDLYSVSQALVHPERNTTNISFLRLVGAGQPEGETFLIEDVVSRDGLERMAERIRRASGRFYEQYLKPTNLIVSVSTSVKEASHVGG